VVQTPIERKELIARRHVKLCLSFYCYGKGLCVFYVMKCRAVVTQTDVVARYCYSKSFVRPSVCPSVRLAVCLSVRDVNVPWSYK